jgi:hypothetical protein
MRDDRFDAGLNANLDIGSVMFVCDLRACITKLDVGH